MGVISSPNDLLFWPTVCPGSDWLAWSPPSTWSWFVVTETNKVNQKSREGLTSPNRVHTQSTWDWRLGLVILFLFSPCFTPLRVHHVSRYLIGGIFTQCLRVTWQSIYIYNYIYIYIYGQLHDCVSAPWIFPFHQLQIDLRQEHRPTTAPDTNLKLEDIGEDSSDSGVEHLLD